MRKVPGPFQAWDVALRGVVGDVAIATIVEGAKTPDLLDRCERLRAATLDRLGREGAETLWRLGGSQALRVIVTELVKVLDG